MMSLFFFSNKKSFFLALFLVMAQHVHTMDMDIVKCGLKAGVAAVPGLALLDAKYISGYIVPSIIIACFGSERLTNFTTYSPGYKTQAIMVGISLIFNSWFFYKQSKLFEDPAAYDKQQLKPWFAWSSRSIEKAVGSKPAENSKIYFNTIGKVL